LKPVLCLFIHRYRWGFQIRGDERGFLEKARIYKKKGLKLIAVEFDPSLQKGSGEDCYESVRIGAVPLPVRSPITLLNLVIKTVFGVASARLERPSGVYAYNQDPENVVTGYALKLLYHVPLAVVYHHVTLSKMQTFGPGFTRRRADGYSVLASIYYSIVPAFNRYCAVHADVQISLSESTKSEVGSVLGLEECTVAGNGLDHSKFRPLERQKVFDAIFLGRLVPQKGIDVLLKAWKLVLRESPSASLVLVGGSDEPQLLGYKKMIKELGIEENVRLTGFLDDARVVECLNSSKLFVFPSRREGFAQAVSQAMSCGICCVVSDISSLREMYGESAVLVPPDNPERLSDAILALLNDENARKRFGEMGIEATRRLDWETVVNREISAVFRAPSPTAMAPPDAPGVIIQQ
jgi:glycosyltransferase involved in cell wall biosynthesis